MEQPVWSSHIERAKWFESYIKGTAEPPSPTTAIDLPNCTDNLETPAQHNDTIDRTTLVNYTMKYGVPDDKRALRSLTWKLLFNYLPLDRTKWSSTVKTKRKQYDTWVKEFVTNPYADLAKHKKEQKDEKEKNEHNNDQNVPPTDSNPDSPLVDNNSNQTDNKTGKQIDQWVLVEPDEDPLSAILGGTKKVAKRSQETSPALTTKTIDMNDPPNDKKTDKKTEQPNRWQQYYIDETMRLEIDKDIQRTYSTLHFFQKPVHPEDECYYQIKNSQHQHQQQQQQDLNGIDEAEQTNSEIPHQDGKFNNNSDSNLKADLFGITKTNNTASGGLFGDDNNDDTVEGGIKYSDLSNNTDETTAQPTSLSVQIRPFRHQDALSRILFLYARLNPVRYVQGMNELLAPIYYVFASDPDHLTTRHGKSLLSKKSAENNSQSVKDDNNNNNDDNDEEFEFEFSDAEADAFFVFSTLMSEIRDRYIKSLDNSEHGILSIVARFDSLLKTLDYDLWYYLQEQGVDPRFYSFRWITLLLSQDFELPDLLRLWDSLFSDPVRFISDDDFFQKSMGCIQRLELDTKSDLTTSPSSLTPNQTTRNASFSHSGEHPHIGPQTTAKSSSSSKKNEVVDKARIMAALTPTDPNYRLELYVCCAMLVHLREELMGCDFTECLYKIHHYPEEKREIDRILALSFQLRQEHLYKLWSQQHNQKTPSKPARLLHNFIDRVSSSNSTPSSPTPTHTNSNEQRHTSHQQHQQNQQHQQQHQSRNHHGDRRPSPPPPSHRQQPQPRVHNTSQKSAPSTMDSLVAWFKK